MEDNEKTVDKQCLFCGGFDIFILIILLFIIFGGSLFPSFGLNTAKKDD